MHSIEAIGHLMLVVGVAVQVVTAIIVLLVTTPGTERRRRVSFRGTLAAIRRRRAQAADGRCPAHLDAECPTD